jgi:hypothetical protein
VQTKEKTFEAKWKDGMYGQIKSRAPTLRPIKSSNMHNVNKNHVKNDTRQGMVAPYLKGSFKIDLFCFLQTTKRGNASHHI